MKAIFTTLCLCIISAHGNRFDHDVHYKSSETGDEIKLKSVGNLTNRILCKEGRLSIAVNDVIEAKKWKVGDIIIGSNKWKCPINPRESEVSGIYAKAASVLWRGPNRVDVETSSAGPLDVFENADIEIHYTPSENKPGEGHHRQKRRISNVLTDILGNLDWNADYVASVPFNPSGQPIILYKTPSDPDVQVVTKDIGDFEKMKKDFDFYMTCLSCKGQSKISYHLSLRINKVNNKPQIVKYQSQVETKDALHYNMTVESLSEITLTHQQSLWKTEPKNLAKIEIAMFKKFPPIVLNIDYTSESFLELTATTKGVAKFKGDFDLSGQYVLNFNASIHWSLRDIHIMNGPPLVSEHAFLSGNVDIRKHIIDGTLSRHCRANCFGEAERNALSDMESICGPVTEKTVRGDKNFEKLEQLFGDFILFASEESQADWCGDEFRSCISCVNKTVGDEEDAYSKCADRMMTTTMATHITKLGRFIKAEWPTRKLIIKEAWDEPTSEYPNGRHGNSSLHYEGRAVTAGISRQIIGDLTKFVFEEKRSVLQRLGELAVCSGFGFVKSDNVTKDIEVCMSPTPDIKSRRKRATGSARNSNSDHERENFKRALSFIGTPTFTRTDLKNPEYVLRPGELYPKGKTLHEACAPPYYKVSAETLKNIDNLFQYPFDNVNFLGEGSSKSSCSSETRACKETCAYKDTKEPRDWCTSRTFIAGAARRLMNLANWVQAHSGQTGEMIFLIDVTGSMGRETLDAFKQVLLNLFEKHNKLNTNTKRQIQIGVSSFSNTYKRVFTKKRNVLPSDLSGLVFENSRDTNIKLALDSVKNEFSTGKGTDFHKVLVLMTDGMSNYPDGVNVSATTLKNSGIKIATVAAGGYIDDLLLKDVASSGKIEKLYFELNLIASMDEKLLNLVSTGNSVQVKTASSPDLMKDVRGIKLLPPDDGSLTSTELAALAIKSGFHCVQHNRDSSVDVYVKAHDGFRAQVTLFPNINLIAVPPPIGEEKEYEYPSKLARETRSGLLFDGYDKEAQISDSFKVKDFLTPSKRSFRLDPTLVECLEAVIDDLRGNITIVHGYRTRSANQQNIGKRHREEKLRYQAGQAVAVKSAKRGKSLLDIGTSIIRGCTPILRLQRGPPIIPDDPETACATPDYGDDLFFLAFKKNGAGFASSNECTDTKTERKTVADKFLKELVSAAGSGTVSQATLRTDVTKCLVDTCGGCPGSGDVWDKKVEYCATLIHKYLEKVRRAFKNLHDKTTFFNTDNVNSSMHSLACHDGNMCVENTQLYSLLQPIITAKYNPDPTLSAQELLFSPNGNPSPLAEIVEQELAYRCSGNILMVYNRRVENIEFNIAHNVAKDKVLGTIQKKIETWATAACPTRSRLAIAPFTSKTIPSHRTKRSLERSKERNDEKFRMRNWELEWLFNT
ncbi:hypothetical protein KUTeg_009924 [Tegillarca granosa]|uniref:VWFA domain-containing protein n=1 Tax=Tegillarca granosa TaxID=220873 RepID=A0ABQ9F8J6_TEGGR|nr:hypothetical protein KUTeg_009924 [Tegillarca granosa]